MPPATLEKPQPIAQLKGDSEREKEEYLLARGWKKYGVGAFARWRDPNVPTYDTYSKPGEGRKPMRENEDGHMERIMAQFGKGAANKKAVEQVIMTPGRPPMSLDEAITFIQMQELYAEEQRDREEAAKEREKAMNETAKKGTT